MADAGYHSEANLETLEIKKIDGYIADRRYRARDLRYRGQDKHIAKDDALWDRSPRQDRPVQFKTSEFEVASDLSHCICPADKRLAWCTTSRNSRTAGTADEPKPIAAIPTPRPHELDAR